MPKARIKGKLPIEIVVRADERHHTSVRKPRTHAYRRASEAPVSARAVAVIRPVPIIIALPLFLCTLSGKRQLQACRYRSGALPGSPFLANFRVAYNPLGIIRLDRRMAVMRQLDRCPHGVGTSKPVDCEDDLAGHRQGLSSKLALSLSINSGRFPSDAHG